MLGLLVEWYTEPAIRQSHAVRASFCATECRAAVEGVIQLFVVLLIHEVEERG